MKQFKLRSIFLIMIVFAIGIAASQLMRGERLVLTTLPLHSEEVYDLHVPAKQIVARYAEIEHLTICTDELIILSTEKHRKSAIAIVENWLKETRVGREGSRSSSLEGGTDDDERSDADSPRE